MQGGSAGWERTREAGPGNWRKTSARTRTKISKEDESA